VARLAREADKATGKRHQGQQDDLGASEDEAEDDAASEGHHPKFNCQHPADRDRLWDRSWMLHEEISRIEWQGEQVYHMPAYNALASRVIVDQLTPLLPKDNEVVNAQVKHLHLMLDAVKVTDLTLHQGGRRQGQDPDHRQSPHGNSASSLSHSLDDRD
jgi:hypothetical protein